MVASRVSLAGSDASIEEALGVTSEALEAAGALGTLLSQRAIEHLSTALGQPVAVGYAITRAITAAEAEGENWAYFHPIDLQLDVADRLFSPLLLLPKAELQAILPSAQGSADLPDMEALGALLRGLADQLSNDLVGTFTPSVQVSLLAEGEAAHDSTGPYLRVQHTVSVGELGLDTEFTVIHLIPADAVAALAGQVAAESGAAASGASTEAPSAPAAAPPSRTTPPARPAPAQTSAFSGNAPSWAGGEARTMEDAMASGPTAGNAGATNTATGNAGTSIHPVQFQPFEGELDSIGGTNLDLLLDVSLRVSVELGRTDLTIKDVLALGPGSVVELDKLAGEPVDILVNERLIAKGEVVVVDENFGVRVTDIVSPQKRIGKIR